ncbi:MAG: hypothetical protein QM564_08950 [Bergeyella sp.]
MKKQLLLILLLLSGFVYSQKQIHVSDKAAQRISEHKVIAILPFDVNITYKKQPKNFSAEANRDQEIAMSTNIQTSMYTFLLRRKNEYFVDFQDVDKTNILLKKHGVYDKLDTLTKDEIAQILGVDGVISGKFEIHNSKSDGAAMTSMILWGYSGKTGTGTLTMNIHDGKDGELLWRFFKTMKDYLGKSTDNLVEGMMRKVSRNFPYYK